MGTRKGCKHRVGYFPVTNSVKAGSSLSKVDPTKTTSLRYNFGRALTNRLNRLKGDLFTLVHSQDVLGKRPLAHTYGSWATTNETYHYASTQVAIQDQEVLDLLSILQLALPDDDVVKLESHAHITVRYGLHQLEGTPQAVQAIVGGSGEIIATFGNVSIFEVEKEGIKLDVLKVEVFSPDLKDLNSRLGFLPNTQTYDYNPHMTIAYMKTGTGKDFCGHLSGITGKVMKFTEVEYSSKEGGITLVPTMLPVNNTQWITKEYTEQLSLFQDWLKGKVYDHLTGNDEQDEWKKYTLAAYQKGVIKAFDEVNSKQLALSSSKKDLIASHQGRRVQFVRDITSRNISGGSIGLLLSRANSDLEGVFSVMTTHMNRTFSDGIISQKDSKSIAGQLIRDVESIGNKRVKLVAHTSVVRAYNEGKLDAYESLGVRNVGVDIEWSIKNQRMCTACRNVASITLSIKDARGQLPIHVGCCCAWTPVS